MFGFVEVAFPLPSPHQKMVWLLATTVPVSYERKANRRFDRTVLSIPNKKTNFHKHCNLPVKMNFKKFLKIWTKSNLENFSERNIQLKGTVAQEKLLNWGLGEMDWTLTIDRTWFLHFPDQLFKCHNIWTVCRLDVKPVWSLSKTDALR